MKARLVVFPVRGRNWCFARSIDQAATHAGSASEPLKMRDLWKRVSSCPGGVARTTELVADFVANKMNRAWTTLGKAPTGSIKHKIYGFGQRLIERVQPSELFLKSISKDLTRLEVTFPISLNPRLVRRRLRHVAMRGSVYHRRYFYSSVSMLPLTSIFSVLPLPNIPFFWILFRAYSRWQALQGSNKLMLLLSDCPKSWTSIASKSVVDETVDGNTIKHATLSPPSCPWVLEPSKELEKLVSAECTHSNISNCSICTICEAYELDKSQFHLETALSQPSKQSWENQRSYKDGNRLSEDDRSFVLDKIFHYHPDKASKVTDSVDFIKIDKHIIFWKHDDFASYEPTAPEPIWRTLYCRKYPEIGGAFNRKYFARKRPGNQSIPRTPSEKPFINWRFRGRCALEDSEIAGELWIRCDVLGCDPFLS